MINIIRRLRNSIIRLNVKKTRFDILQSKLDVIATSLDDVAASIKNTEKFAQNILAVCDDVAASIKNAEKFAQNVLAVNLEQNEAVRVVFIAQAPEIWSSWRSVWMAAKKDPRFVTKVVLSPFIHPHSSQAITYDKMRQCLIDEQVPFCSSEYFDVDGFRPHVVFVQNPYDETRPEKFKIDRLIKSGARLAYIPYGLEMGGGEWNIAAQFDSLLHRSAWRIFARSERHKKMFSKYCSAGNSHVVVTGHPKFDSQNANTSLKAPEQLIDKIRGRKVILWTPHFSVGDPPTWSTYKLYGELILKEILSRKDLFLLIRPHPLFFQAMRQNNLWGTEGEQGFRQMINDSNNIALDENADYQQAFLVSDALMTDVGSFLLEYLPTGKPILYLHHPDGLGMNDDGELVKYLYTAICKADISSFIDMIALGEDPRKLERQAVLPEFLFGLKTDIGEKICQHIYSCISAGDTYFPQLSNGSGGQYSSEQYWEKCSYTYLATPDYYDAKESILGKVLMQLPKFEKGIDIGCGDGRYTFILGKHVKEITGYDISSSLINKAKEAAVALNAGNISFVTQEFEKILPYEKYDLVTCFGVTSCIIDDIKFLRIVDKFKMLSRDGAYLLLIDTLSSAQEQSVTDQSGYIAKYRAIDDYRGLVVRRGFVLKEEILIKEDTESKLVNKLFVFEFKNSHQVDNVC